MQTGARLAWLRSDNETIEGRRQADVHSGDSRAEVRECSFAEIQEVRLMGAGPDPRLIAIIGELDRTFSQDRADEMGRFYSEDARLMWPALEDVIGRTKIQDAFQRLVGAYSTIRWEPQREFVLSTDDRAVAIGRFIEIRKRREDNQVEQVHGRLVKVWQLEADGEWRLSVLMTSRYAENALTGKEATGSGDNRVRNR